MKVTGTWRVLAATVLLVAGAGGPALPAASAAQGREGPVTTRPDSGGASLDVRTGSPGSGGGVSGSPVGSGSSGNGSASGGGGLCRHGGVQIPCTRGAGHWSSQRGCYLTFLGDSMPVSLGGTGAVGQADEGMLYYLCSPPGGVTGTVVQIPAGDAAAATAGVVIDPEVLARSAVESMRVRAVDIGIVPESSSDSVGLVGLPVWLWVESPGPQTWGPTTASASVPGGPTVTATARVTEVVWDLGDGTRVVCTTAGTRYENYFRDGESPDCGHTYTRSSVDRDNEAYRVTATTSWQVDWSSTSGVSGSFVVGDLLAETSVRVGELQVLVQ